MKRRQEKGEEGRSSVVSIRLPEALIKEFIRVSEKDHFLDVSEAVRTIVRERYLESRDPQAYQVKKLRKEISESLQKEIARERQDSLVRELQEIRDLLLKKQQEGKDGEKR